MTKEIQEIMNGNRKIKHLRIEGETLGFDTQFHNDWNFTPRDIEQIIYTLQQRIDKAIEYIKNMYGNEIEFNFKREQLLDILKGEENE